MIVFPRCSTQVENRADYRLVFDGGMRLTGLLCLGMVPIESSSPIQEGSSNSILNGYLKIRATIGNI